MKLKSTHLKIAVISGVFFCFPIQSGVARAADPYDQGPQPTSYTSLSQLPGYVETKALLAQGTGAVLPAQANYYVSPSGSDSNDGTSQGRAFRSIDYAVSKLKAGDTLVIQEGTYAGPVTLRSSGTEDAYITIQGAGKVVLNLESSGGLVDGFDTAGQDYIRFKNLTIIGGSHAIEIDGGSHHIEVDGLKTDRSRFAVWMKDASFVSVRNAFVQNARNGFRGEGTTHDVSFENVEVYNSKEGHVQDDGFVNGDGFIFEQDTYNLSFKNILTAYNSDAGLDIKGDNVQIQNVISHHNTNGLKLWGSGISVFNALIYNQQDQTSPTGRVTGGVGINVRAGSTRVYNATLYNNGDVDAKPTYGASLHLENSIVMRSAAGDLYTPLGTFTSKNVLWYRPGAALPAIPLPGGGLWADPKFLNPSAGDFRRAAGAPAGGLGFFYFQIPSSTPAPPAPPFRVNAQQYIWTSGSVLKYGSDVLTMYENRSVAYYVTASGKGTYQLSLETAQVTRAAVPSVGYRFNFDVYLDGDFVASASFSALSEFRASYIALGALEAGTHLVRLVWKNDVYVSPTLDANAGLRNLQLIRQ